MAAIRRQAIGQVKPTFDHLKTQLDEIIKSEICKINIHLFNNFLVALVLEQCTIETIERTVLLKMKSHNVRESLITKCHSFARNYFVLIEQLKTEKNMKEIENAIGYLNQTRTELEKNKESKSFLELPKAIPMDNKKEYGCDLYALALSFLLPEKKTPIKDEHMALAQEATELLSRFRMDFEAFMETDNMFRKDPFLPYKTIYHLNLINRLLTKIEPTLKLSTPNTGSLTSPQDALLQLMGLKTGFLNSPENITNLAKKAGVILDIKFGLTLLKASLHQIMDIFDPKSTDERFDSIRISLMEISIVETVRGNNENIARLDKIVSKSLTLGSVTKHQKDPTREMAELLQAKKTFQALEHYPNFLNFNAQNKINRLDDFGALHQTLIVILNQLLLLQSSQFKEKWNVQKLIPINPSISKKSLTSKMEQVVQHMLNLLLMTEGTVLANFFNGKHHEVEKTLSPVAALLLENYAFLIKNKTPNQADIQRALTSLDFFLRLLSFFNANGFSRNSAPASDPLIRSLAKIFPDHLKYDNHQFDDFIYQECERLEKLLPHNEEFKHHTESEFSREFEAWLDADRAILEALEKEKAARLKAAKDEKDRKIKNQKKKKAKNKKESKSVDEEPLEEKRPVETQSEQYNLYLAASKEFRAQKAKSEKEQNFQDALKLYADAEKKALDVKDHATVAYALSGIAECYLYDTMIHLNNAKTHLIDFYHVFTRNMVPQYQEDLKLAQIPHLKAIEFAEKAINYFDKEVLADKDSLSSHDKRKLDEISWGLKQVLHKAQLDMKETQDFVKKHIDKMKHRKVALERSRELAIQRIGIRAWKNKVNPSNFYRDRREACDIMIDTQEQIEECFTGLTSAMNNPLSTLEKLQPRSLHAPEPLAETFIARLTDMHQFIISERLANPGTVLALAAPEPAAEPIVSTLSLEPPSTPEVKNDEEEKELNLAMEASLSEISVPVVSEHKRPPIVSTPYDNANSANERVAALWNIPVPDSTERKQVLEATITRDLTPSEAAFISKMTSFPPTNQSEATVVSVTSVHATLYALNSRNHNPPYQLTETLMALEDAYRWKDPALMEVALDKFIHYWECNKFDNTYSSNFKEKMIHAMQEDRMARLNPNEAFLVGCMKFIGVDFPEAKAINHFRGYDYFKFVTSFTFEENHPIYLASLLFLTRTQADELPYKELMIRQKNNWVKKDVIIENFKILAGEGIPLANVFLGRFYEKLASYEEANRNDYLQKAKLCYYAAKKDNCSFAEPHIGLLGKEGGLYPRAIVR